MKTDVFISYSSRDRAVANALVHYLENVQVRCWIAPRDIAPGADYAEVIDEAIDGAMVFVLLFSKRSQLSVWCKKETNLAVSRGKVILPIRLEDITPEGAMCLYLSDKHWIDAMPNPQQHFDQVKDVVLGLCRKSEEIPSSHADSSVVFSSAKSDCIPFPTQTSSQKNRGSVFRKALCWLPLIVLPCVGSIFVWDALRPTENYYADYVDSYGLPEGTFPLAKDELRGRNIHYRFEYQGIRFGKSIHADSADWSFVNLIGCQRVLRRVVQSNSAGRPREWRHTEYSDRSPVLEFTYDTDGILRQIVCRAPSGAFKRRLVLSDGEGVVNGVIELKGEKSSQAIMESASVTSSGMMGGPMAGGQGGASEIAQYQLKRNEQGRMIERRFKDVMGYKFVSDSEGVYGFSYKLDGLGRTEELWYLDVNGDRRENKKGVAGRKYHYVGRNMDRAEYVNASGTPTLGHVGWMVCVNGFDKFDNGTCSRFYDDKGQPTTCADGYAEVRYEYDARGNRTSVRDYGTDGEPCLIKDGGAECRYEYDACGNMTSVSFYGTDGKPCLIKAGCAECRYENDACGNMTSVSFYGTDGKPCLNKEGQAQIRYEYDTRGNMMSMCFYGVDGKPCLNKDGAAECRYEYDARGNTTSVRHYGTDGEPCLLKDGYAECRSEYDVRGNMTSVSFYGTDGKPCLNKEGIAGWIAEYNVHGLETRRTFVDADGKPCRHKDGIAECRREYNARGNLMLMRYYGTDGKPCLHECGCAECRCEYDAHGNQTVVRFCGVDGKPCVSKWGFAECRMEYDDRGHVVAGRAYGIDGKPLFSDGKRFFEARREYDARGNVTAHRCYGSDGNPCLGEDGYAGYVCEYDAHGHEIRRVNIGIDGHPATNGIVECRNEYDARGNNVSCRYYGANGVLCLHAEGYAGWKAEYDVRDMEIRRVYIGVDGRPMQVKDGFAEYRRAYDALGNKVEECYYGADGEPVVDKDGVHQNCWRYEMIAGESRDVASWYLDADGREVTNKFGCARLEKQYDCRGTLKRFDMYALPGCGGLYGKENAHHIISVCDDGGVLKEMKILDVDGKEVND